MTTSLGDWLASATATPFLATEIPMLEEGSLEYLISSVNEPAASAAAIVLATIVAAGSFANAGSCGAVLVGSEPTFVAVLLAPSARGIVTPAATNKATTRAITGHLRQTGRLPRGVARLEAGAQLPDWGSVGGLTGRSFQACPGCGRLDGAGAGELGGARGPVWGCQSGCPLRCDG